MNTHVAKQLGRNRIRVAMIVTGFPNSDDPVGGIFNLRAAKALNHSVDVEVVRLRAWKPGRKAIEFSSSEGIPVITVTAPQLPKSTRLNIISNIIVYRHVGWSRLSTFLQTCHLIHSVGADFPGVLASSWANWAGVHHVTQVIGDLIRCRSNVSVVRDRRMGKMRSWRSVQQQCLGKIIFGALSKEQKCPDSLARCRLGTLPSFRCGWGISGQIISCSALVSWGLFLPMPHCHMAPIPRAEKRCWLRGRLQRKTYGPPRLC